MCIGAQQVDPALARSINHLDTPIGVRTPRRMTPGMSESEPAAFRFFLTLLQLG